MAGNPTVLPDAAVPNDDDGSIQKPGNKDQTFSRVVIRNEQITKTIKRQGQEDIIIPLQIAVADHIANHLGMEQVDIGNLPDGARMPRGARVGTRTCQVPLMVGGNVDKSEKGNTRMLSFPVPSYFTIPQIAQFLSVEIKQNKPKWFRIKGGYTYPLN